MSDDPSPSDFAPFIALAIVLVLGVLAFVLLLVAALIRSGLAPATSAVPATPAAVTTPAANATALNRLAVIDGDQIYTVDPDGSKRLNLDHNGSVPTAALIWSHDGQHLIFSETGRGQGRLISAQPDGQAPRVLYETDQLSAPFYMNGSPDDRFVAFLVPSAANAMELQVAQTDQPHSARLAVPGQPNYASWSPDSQALVVHIGSNRADAFVGTYTLSDTEPNKIETNPAAFQAPVWSPAGPAAQRWVYARQRGSQGELVMNTDGRVESLASFEGGIAFALAPDGQHAAYTISTADSFLYRGLTVVDLAGHSSQTIYKGDLVGFFWSPDGQKIAYLTGALVEPSSIGRAGGLASPPVQQTRRTLQLTWHVIDLASGQTLDLSTFQPTEAFVYLITYFDQFAQSIAVWSPDSRSLVYTGTPLVGGRGVYVIETQPKSAPRFAGTGDFAIWSWH